MRIKLLALILALGIAALLLTACTGNIAASWPGVTVDQGTAYMAFNQRMFAIDTTKGTEIWHYPATANARISFYAPPALTPDGQLIVGGYNNVLYSLNPVSGQENWTFTESKYRYVASPLVTADTIIAPNGGQSVYALDFKGNKIWEFKGSGEFWSKPVADESCHCIYQPSMDRTIYAIDQKTGKLLWKTKKLEGSIVGNPVLSPDGVLYFGTFGSQVHALDTKTHKLLWSSPTAGWVWAGPLLDESTLYVTDLKGNLYALDAKTGAEKWKYTADGAITASPQKYGDVIILGTEKKTLIAVDLSGKESWKQPLAGKILGNFNLAGDTLLVSATDAETSLQAFDSTGKVQWTYLVPKK